MTVPIRPKIYHIVHVDRLPSIIQSNGLWCDAEITKHTEMGTSIGMSSIKARRLNELTLTSHPGLYVGECVPFYFCPRSTMLYVIHMANNPELSYRGGQGPIVHLECDLHATVAWAAANNRRWAFTLTNAGSRFFEDRCDLTQLNEIDWDAVQTNKWSGPGISSLIKEGKQAEFLIETSFPWGLVERIGVLTKAAYGAVAHALAMSVHKPRLELKREWYY